MAKKLSKASFTLLSGAVAAMATEAGFLFAPKADADKLVSERAGLIEINPSVTEQATGNIAVRATEAGKAEVEAVNGKTAAASAPKPALILLDGLTKPEKSRGRGVAGVSVYPFDTMAVGQAFFVADTPAKPDAVKSISSTIGSANKRFELAAKVGETHKAFGVYRVTKESEQAAKTGGPGALIFRESDVTLTSERFAKIREPKKTRAPKAAPAVPSTPISTVTDAAVAASADAI